MPLFPFSNSCFCLVVVVTISTSTVVQANVGSLSDRVFMGGDVVEAACAIAPEYLGQHLVLKSISPDRLIRSEVVSYPFSIGLINCDPGSASRLGFQVTFDGLVDGGRFKLQGEGQGLAMEIRDDRGFVVLPGVAMPPHFVPAGGGRLDYNLRLIGNQELIKAGSYFAFLKYKLDYY